jgi:endonuclease/exonuclease/phosphatase family metal-dependent hydrolase
MKIIFKKLIRWISYFLLIVIVALSAFLWFGTYHPAEVESMAVTCPESAPTVKTGQSLKVLTWNVQTMSGKNYVFWSDLPNNDGPDEKPSPKDITLTLSEVARIIKDEKPDIILLQEIDNGAERTNYENQFARLMKLLPSDYVCNTSAFDWKAAYVPHPRIRGAVGWQVAILSKYKISAAERHQLAVPPSSIIEKPFRIKPAILEAHLPMTGGGEFIAMTVHLDLYVPGTDTKTVQLEQINQLLASLDKADVPWVIGGDFNLLPFDDAAFQRLPVEHQRSYNPQSEIKLMFDKHQAVPSSDEVTGANFAQWFTRFPNDPAILAPDRTLDYMFMSPGIIIGDHYVRLKDTLKISDHFPLISNLKLP